MLDVLAGVAIVMSVGSLFAMADIIYTLIKDSRKEKE